VARERWRERDEHTLPPPPHTEIKRERKRISEGTTVEGMREGRSNVLK